MTREDVIFELGMRFEAVWCGSMGCGGNHRNHPTMGKIICRCSENMAENILSAVEEFYILTPKE